jgi:hypothetical protein
VDCLGWVAFAEKLEVADCGLGGVRGWGGALVVSFGEVRWSSCWGVCTFRRMLGLELRERARWAFVSFRTCSFPVVEFDLFGMRRGFGGWFVHLHYTSPAYILHLALVGCQP